MFKKKKKKKGTASGVWPIFECCCFSMNLRNCITGSVTLFTTFCISCQITAYGQNKKMNIFWDTNRGRRNIWDCNNPGGLFSWLPLKWSPFASLWPGRKGRKRGIFLLFFLKLALCSALTLSCKILKTLSFKSAKDDRTPSAMSNPTEDSGCSYGPGILQDCTLTPHSPFFQLQTTESHLQHL